ncbi:hypothetical protein FACHB389_19155 [Nostoc calcicola FACHB-389]|nr:DUF4263 domain-containing protein [Nostoc calcicola FACHB-3891]OKH32777.1 hypothetical protein FACHB389_19155 [Nostoc calcicola FACHB-389]
MNLYDTDYTILTPDEEEKIRLLEEQEVIKKIGNIKITEPLFYKYPKAIRHYMSLFPNNYMDFAELQEREELKDKLACFQKLLESEDVNERSILKFISEYRAYFIVASLLNYFDFGHHATYLFPEFQLGNSYQADYLIIGRGSGGHQFVFVELEAPKGNGIILTDGELGEVFRKGKKQLRDWQGWLDGYYSSLKETFNKSRRADALLPDEFVTMDRSRLHFVVIAGKRNNFTNKTYEIKRRENMDTNILLLHYDNLIDAATNVIGKKTY